MKLGLPTTVGTIVVLLSAPACSQDPADLQDEPYNVIPHIPDDCSDIRVISVRGSDEPYPGRGGRMLGTICALFESEGLSCDYEDVSYPANISYSGIFCESAHVGAVNGRAQMTDYVQRCPDSRLVMMGYSQGASVISDLLGGGGGPIFDCEQPSNPSLPRGTAPGSSVAAAAIFGNPRHTADQPYNIGTGSPYDGVYGRSGQQLSDINEYEDILGDWCNFGDPVCAVGSEPVNVYDHWNYYDLYTDVASRWIVATALGYTDQRLDLDQDGQDESVVLTTGSRRAQNNTGDDGNSEEDGAAKLDLTASGVLALMPFLVVWSGL